MQPAVLLLLIEGWLGFVALVVVGLVLLALYILWEQSYESGVRDFLKLLAKKEAGDFSLAVGTAGKGFLTSQVKIPAKSRDKHLYIVGASGSGKSSLIYNLILQDIHAGMGLILIDPHGDLVKDLIPLLGEHGNRTQILDLENLEQMLAYNPFVRKEGVLVAEQVAKLMLAFKRVWADSWGPRMEDVLRHSLTLLIEQGYTLLEFERLLTDADFRELLVGRTEQQQARDYFQYRYNSWSDKEKSLNTESSLNKVSALLADPRVAARLAQTEDCVKVSDVVAGNRILLVNLAKGRLAANADLFGAFLMADIETTFLSRPKEQRSLFAVYIDEFQNIATESFASVLAEARKFGMCLTLVHQSLMQLDPELISLILGNAQSQVYFRVARQDAERLAKEANNIMSQLEEQIEKYNNRPEGERAKKQLTLSEMWELAYHKLTDLEPRHAYVTIRGLVNEPKEITSMDNPQGSEGTFEYGSEYRTLIDLEAVAVARQSAIESELEAIAVANTPPPKPRTTRKKVSAMDFLATE